MFFLEACPLPLVLFFDDDSPDNLSLPPFSIFFFFFSYCLVFSAIATATFWVINFPMISASIDISLSSSTAVSSAVLVTFWTFSSFDILSSNLLKWYCFMNSPQPEKNMTYRVILSFMYSAASIKASGWGGGSLTAGLTATAIVVLSIDAATASLSLKRRLALSLKVSEGAG